MNKVLIVTSGFINLLATIMHLAFWKVLDWPDSLACLSDANRVLIQMLNGHVALTAFIFFWISVFHYKELLSTKLGRAMLLGMSLYKFLRGFEEFIYHDIEYIFSGFNYFIFVLYFIFGLMYLIPFFTVIGGRK